MIQKMILVGVISLLAIGCGESANSKVMSGKYKLGMSVEQVQQLMSRNYKIHEAGIKYGPKTTANCKRPVTPASTVR